MPDVVDLNDLISGGNIAPQLPGEIEAEWNLLGGDVNLSLEEPLNPGDASVLRRYEFFKYTGGYDEVHLPNSAFQGLPNEQPPANEIGQFIAANMVAAVFDVPEPSSLGLMLSGLGIAGLARLRRRQ